MLQSSLSLYYHKQIRRVLESVKVNAYFFISKQTMSEIIFCGATHAKVSQAHALHQAWILEVLSKQCLFLF